ncbi:hypothetical protein, partial [Streptomyces syringium]|uniref:hypothetical protein n=1 Tax=Streptomyces syringium TaxID=76729 RepID=UPI0033A95E0B
MTARLPGPEKGGAIPSAAVLGPQQAVRTHSPGTAAQPPGSPTVQPPGSPAWEKLYEKLLGCVDGVWDLNCLWGLAWGMRLGEVIVV